MAFTGSSWGRRVKLTGLTPASTLAGYVAVITLDNIPVEAIDAGVNSALNGGGDLRFSTDDAGATQLPCEVVSYVTSATAGLRKCEIHVRFSTYSSAAREVWAFYKKTGESQPVSTAAFGRNAVWSDYEAVLHMGETGTDGVFTDSTGNGHDTTLTTGSTLGTSTAGHPFGGSWPDFTQAEAITLASSSGAIDSSAFTLSVWADADISNYALGLFGNRSNSPDNNWAQMSAAQRVSSKGDSVENFLDDGSRALTPTLVKMRQNASTMDGMDDGVAYGSDTSITSGEGIVGATNFRIGTYYDDGSGRRYNGRACEARIKKSFDSDVWNTLEYSNQSSPATFWTVGAPEDTVGGGVTLTVNGALHAHLADHLALIQKNTLSVAEALHSHSVDSVSLTQRNTITVNESLHGHAADHVTLSQSSVLIVGDAVHAHSADNLTLTQKNTLTVNETGHSHSVDNVTLAAGNLLAVQEALHAHTADSVALVQKNTLTVQEALHSIGSDNLTLSNSVSLSVFDSAHSHTADAVTISQANILAVQDALHSVTSDNLGLITDAILIVDSALHALISDTINFNIGSIETPASRTYAVPFENRVFVVPYENRIYIVKG